MNYKYLIFETIILIFYINTVLSETSLKITIRKCCTNDYELSSNLNSCIKKDNRTQNDLKMFIKKSMSGTSPKNISLSISKSTDDINLKCNDIQRIKSFKVEQKFTLTQSGISTGTLKSRPDYCIDSNEDGQIMVLTCSCKHDTCVHFCCEKGHVLDLSINETNKCRRATHMIDDWIFDSNHNYTVIHRNWNVPHCFGEELYPLDEATKILVLPNGTLSFVEYDIDILKNPEIYCIGDLFTNNTTMKSALVCFEAPDKTEEKIHAIVYGVLFLIGAIFLLVTLCIYAILPSLRRNAQGLGLMAHCTCMLVAYIALIITKAEGPYLEDFACHFIAYIVQYFLLAAFFWMNVICLEVSSLFKSLACVLHSDLSELNRFYLYAIYAMGIPFIIFIITITLNSLDNVHDFIHPNIGTNKCWFEDDDTESKAIIFFFYGPMGIVLLCNTLLFLSEVVQIRCSCCLLDQEGYKLFFKMCMLMGVTWISEIVSWAVGGEDYYWYLTDAINILRSVFIFLIFCCKTKTWQELKYVFRQVTQSLNVFDLSHF